MLSACAKLAVLDPVPNRDFADLQQVARHEDTPVPHEILKTAEAEKADLIVLSTHGRGGVAKLLIGSVTEQVLRSSTVDILAIPPVRSN